MRTRKLCSIVAVVIFLIIIFFWYSKESNRKNHIFVNIYGGGWNPIELKINGEVVDIFLNGVTEVSSHCQKGTNNLSVEGKWEETKYINEVSLGIKIYEGVDVFNKNSRMIFEKKIIRDENKPTNLSVSYNFEL